MSARNSLLLCIGLVLAGCAGLSPAPAPLAADTSRLAVAFTPARYLSLTGCGCSLADLGGVDREYNALQSWRQGASRLLLLSAGTTFLPSPDELDADRAGRDFAREAGFLVRALNALGLDVLSPSADDALLDPARVSALRAGSRFAWVSSNLFSRRTGKPIFDPAYTLPGDPLPVTVLGVSGPPTVAPPAGSDVEVRAPESALRGAIASLPKGPRLLVLLAWLPAAERQRLQRLFPEIHLVLGSAPAEEHLSLEQSGAAALSASTFSRGRSMLEYQFTLKGPIQSFYNHTTTGGAVRAMLSYQRELATIDRKLAAKRGVQSELLERRSRLEALQKERAWLSDVNPARATAYDFDALNLGKQFASPSNPVTAILREFEGEER